MSFVDHERYAEHECPPPLARPVGEFSTGGKFLSPAGRWETIGAVVPLPDAAYRVMVYTDRTGPEYGWQFLRSHEFPYLPS